MTNVLLPNKLEQEKNQPSILCRGRFIVSKMDENKMSIY